MKATGLLLPAFSTRRKNDLGIGDTLGMREWIDWAAEYKVGLLQLLPVNENGTDESPYSAISSIALDPIYLSFDPPEIPHLSATDLTAARAELGTALHSHLIDYPAVRAVKLHLLELSFARFQASANFAQATEFRDFQKKNADWLPEYCLFKLLAEIHGPALSWDQWPEDCREPISAKAFVESIRKVNARDVDSRLEFFNYVQWLCFRQWHVVREYADEKGVRLMGDVPIGVSFHSADVFFNQSQFHTDWFGGTAPEGYSEVNPFIHEWGQNWGIPLYNWDAMAADGFAWWKKRIRYLTEIFRVFRIDHILGFYRIYGFPWHPRRNHEFLGLEHHDAAKINDGRLPKWFHHPDDTPENKALNLADGDFRLRAIIEAAGDAEIIAEDLGWVPEYVRPHLEELGIAGYRIPHWDAYEDGSPVMGDVFPENSFASYSTHDHDSLCAIWENLRMTVSLQQQHPTEQGRWAAEGCANSLRLLAGFAGIPIPADNQWPRYSDTIHWRLIKSLLESNSRYAVLMVTDLFALKDRINTPGTVGNGNWRLRLDLSPQQLTQRGEILSRIIQLTGRD